MMENLPKTMAMIAAALAIAGCGGGGGGGNVRPEAPTPARPAPAPEPAPAPRPAPAPEPAPERSTPRIPGLGDYAPVSGAGAFRSAPGGSLGTSLTWGFDRIHVADAHARIVRNTVRGGSRGPWILPGGAAIAVVDDGVDVLHPELEPTRDRGHYDGHDPRIGRIVIQEGLLGGTAGYTEGEFSHGTAVTSLILAHNHRRWHWTPRELTTADKRRIAAEWSFHGVAYAADVRVFGIPLAAPTNAPYEPQQEDVEDIARGRARAREQILRAATAELAYRGSSQLHRVNIVNMSFGYPEMAEQYLDPESRAQMERGLEPLLDFVKGAQGTIFVQAAGNENGRECADRSYAGCASGTLEATSPSFDAALPLWDRSGEVGKRWVAVVATDRENALADFSNRCGHAARWCLAAPGVDILAAYSGPNEAGRHVRTLRTFSGTSFAVPLVSGGLALMRHFFSDTLTMEEMLARMYATANKAPDTVPEGSLCPEHLDTDGDRSDCELSSTHGQGLMDLERATRPVGATTGHGRLADAGGGAIADALAGVEPVVFDSLGYPFRQPLEAQVTIAASAPGSIPSFTAGDEAGRPSWAGLHWREAARVPDAAHTGAWAFAAATGGDGAIHSSGLAWAPHDGSWEAGWLAERDRVFGGRAEGTWAGSGFVHHTGFLRLRKGWTLAEGEAARLGVEWSSTVAHARMRGSGVLRETSGVYTGHRIEVARTVGPSRTAFSIEAPLRAETGTARLKVPVGGTLHTGVRYAERTAALPPEARELRLGATHQREGRYGRLALGAQLRLDAGHRRDGHDWHAGLRWGYDF